MVDTILNAIRPLLKGADPTTAEPSDALVAKARCAIVDAIAEMAAGVVVSPGVMLISDERSRQVHGEGYSAAHDDLEIGGALAIAAIRYALFDVRGASQVRRFVDSAWPWEAFHWKPKTPIVNLKRAGALIAAEIDRRIRAGDQP